MAIRDRESEAALIKEVLFKGCENEAHNSFADVAPPDC
jgi:hypothetical protein